MITREGLIGACLAAGVYGLTALVVFGLCGALAWLLR